MSGCEDQARIKQPAPPLALGSPSGSDSKESVCSAGDLGSIPGLGSSPGGGNGNPLQYSGLENAMDRGAWRTTVRGAAESAVTEHSTAQLTPARTRTPGGEGRGSQPA